MGVSMDVLQSLRGDANWGGGVLDILRTNRCTTYDDCIKWAVSKFYQYNNHIIRQLIYNFPEDAKNSKTGKSFWAPPKRFPTALEFDASDPLHMQFVIAATNLRAQAFGIAPPAGVDPRSPEHIA